MAQHCDIVIRGGTVVDGTNERPAFAADVAIDKGVIVAVEPNSSWQGTEEIDALGKVVTPAWVDMHTHLDAQVSSTRGHR
eukprot:SAG11_NODE_230_length_11943_cov_73.442962_9_plen_80_part_00